MQENNVKQEPILASNTVSNNGSDSAPTTSAPEVKDELSKVATNPKRNILVMVSMVMGIIVMGYNLLAPILFAKNKEDDHISVPEPKTISAPSNVSVDLPPIPQVPEPPKLVEPSPPPQPQLPVAKVEEPVAPPLPTFQPPPVAVVSMPVANKNTQGLSNNYNKDDDAAKQRSEAKRKSSIVLVGGAPQKEQSAISKEQENDFKKRGDLEYVLGQGKLIDAVLESAVNSDFDGEIRAVISRDVYSESAKVVLIPKGTRIFGTFQSGGDTSGRITVTWNKINLESGYTLTMAASAVDNLGRAGVQGRVDHKYAEQMTNAVLTSAFNVAVASGLDKIVPPVTSTATASQTASGVAAVITQATAIAGDPNSIVPPATTPPYPPVNLGTGGNDNGASAKINTICALKAQITDVTSSAYTSMVTACTAAQATVNSPNAQGGLSALLSALSGLASSSAVAAATAATPTQAQQASKTAFTDITTAAKDMMGQVEFKPTVTLDQGTKIKIYVNKDYVFPKDAINKIKVIH